MMTSAPASPPTSATLAAIDATLAVEPAECACGATFLDESMWMVAGRSHCGQDCAHDHEVVASMLSDWDLIFRSLAQLGAQLGAAFGSVAAVILDPSADERLLVRDSWRHELRRPVRGNRGNTSSRVLLDETAAFMRSDDR